MLWFYRTTPHSVTKVTPFELLKGRGPTSELYPVWMTRCLKKQNNLVKDEVCKNVELAQEKQCARYNKKKNVNFKQDISVGDYVRIRKPGFIKKGDIAMP